jgi:hypothetical protein
MTQEDAHYKNCYHYIFMRLFMYTHTQGGQRKCTHSLNDNSVVFMNISLMVDITEH